MFSFAKKKPVVPATAGAAKPGAESQVATAKPSEKQVPPNATDAANESAPHAAVQADSEARPTQKQGENWRITVSRDLGNAFLDYSAVHGAADPSARELLDAAIELGVVADALFNEDKLSRALANTRQSRIPLKGYPICEDANASFSIDISPDRLLAELTITKGRGRGKPLDLKALGAAIKASGLKGLDLEKIRKDVLEFYRGPVVTLDRYRLARGTEPVPGKPRALTFDVKFVDPGELQRLKTIAGGAVRAAAEDTVASIGEMPISEVSHMARAAADSVVATISAGESGTPGVDVYGASIVPPGDESLPVRLLEHLRLVGSSVVSEQDGILDRRDGEDGVPAIRVRPFREATVVVNISADGMLASVCLSEGIGSGTRLSPELVRQALIAKGVVSGIDMDAVETAVVRAVDEGDSTEVVVARGTAPVEPGESRIRFRVKFASGKGVSLRDDGTADFKNQDRITTVEKEQLLAEIVADDAIIVDGVDVLGKVIKARQAPPLSIQIGDGIRRETPEPSKILLVADRPGELFYDGKALSIGAIRTISGDVGPATGNIKFTGSVNITGSVHGGYFVMSKGTVKIAEGVDAALVSADESIHIVHGVKGAGKAVLRARQEIHLGFVEHARLMAIGNIVVQNTCLHCTVRCNGLLSLTTEKGKLVGGRIQAREGVSAAQIGSAGGIQTHISFGQDYLIGDKIELEEQEIAKLQTELARLEGIIHAADRDGQAAELRKGRARKVQLLKLVEKRSERLFWLRERFERHFASRVVVRGTVYPGVTLESHGRTLEISSEKKQVTFTFDLESGRIVETAGSGAPA